MYKMNLKDKKYLFLSVIVFILTFIRIVFNNSENSESMKFMKRFEELNESVDTFNNLPFKKSQFNSCFLYQHTNGFLHDRENDILDRLNKIDFRLDTACFYWDTILYEYEAYFYFDVLMFNENEKLYTARTLSYVNDGWKRFFSIASLANEVVVENKKTKAVGCKYPLIYYVFDSISLYEIGTIQYEIITYQTFGSGLSDESRKETRSYYMKNEEFVKVFLESKNYEDFLERLEIYNYSKRNSKKNVHLSSYPSQLVHKSA